MSLTIIQSLASISSIDGTLSSPFTTIIVPSRAITCLSSQSNLFTESTVLDLCEVDQIASFDNAVKYLSNNKNQEVKSLLEARVDNTK